MADQTPPHFEVVPAESGIIRYWTIVDNVAGRVIAYSIDEVDAHFIVVKLNQPCQDAEAGHAH